VPSLARPAALVLSGLYFLAGNALLNAADLGVIPQKVVLGSPEASQQLLVNDVGTDGRTRDVTRKVQYTVVPPAIAFVDDRGLVRPLAVGKAELVITEGTRKSTVPVEVSGLEHPHPVSYRNEIVPIMTKARCNSGGCHGKAEGQNGFKLSLFGFDPLFDYDALVQEGRGRRLSPVTPETSLVYLKGSARVPHGGGRKIEPGSFRDRLLLRWITEGARFEAPRDAETKIVSIEINPPRQILTTGETQQLQVTAIDASGQRHDATSESEFDSNATTIAEVDAGGLIQAGDVAGDAAVLVRYLGHVGICRITLPRPGVTFERPPENNFVDKHVWDKLKDLGVPPSGLSTDAEFLRRVSFDITGTLPTADDARTFLADKAPDKRAKLIDRLLERPEYVDYWTMKYLDILRADQLLVSPQGTVAMQRWLRKQFAENRPYDRLARDLLTVQGNTSEEGPGSFYKALAKPEESARAVSQLLLGVRIECAQCHHHPSERWSQDDYVGLAGFFTGITQKRLPNGETAIISRGGANLPHPRTNELIPARALGAPEADFKTVTDRRKILADWMTNVDNPFFAKAVANRLWAHYFGRGLVMPIDDIRDTNPAVNEPLMQALVQHMKDVKFDLKAFTRTLLNSRVYQLTSNTVPGNETDVQNFSRSSYRTLPAEVLLDSICQTTGVPEKFNGWPDGYRAIQVWDNRMPSYFFVIFGRPVRATVCECERSGEPSITQALHLLNAPEISEKISHRHGKARELAESKRTPAEIIDEIYLGTLSRMPSDQERTLMLEAFAAQSSAASPEAGRRAAAEDVLWAVMNSKEFVFNH
jgi:hypothetical protein